MPSEREYLTTHPWITFNADLRKADYRLWLMLGEARSKCDHLSRALLKPDVAHELLQVFLVKGVVATTAIEGNTLSEEEARQIIEQTLTLPPSKEYLGQEIRNIVEALNGIRDDVIHDGARVDLSVEKIREYNRLVLDGLELNEGVVPGEIRRHSVTVGSYRGAPWSDCEYLLDRLCEWLNSDAFVAREPLMERPMAILKSVLAHLYLAWIHPFGDGNGRTARLLEVHILLGAGFPMPTAQLLSNHYNLTRSEYYRQLDRASGTEDPWGFTLYAVGGFIDELRSQLDRVWRMQYMDRWEQFIYETFGEVNSESSRRRLRLVKELSRASIANPETGGEPIVVPRGELRRLSPELAEMYATKTERALSRDLNALIEMDLISRQKGGFLPNAEVVLAFQPLRRLPDDAAVGDDEPT